MNGRWLIEVVRANPHPVGSSQSPAAYRIQRRERPAGEWQDVSTAMDSETTLVDQPRGKELEYRALAVNKAADGEPSNTVLAVL